MTFIIVTIAVFLTGFVIGFWCANTGFGRWDWK